MVPVLTSFIPPSHPHLYLPVVFTLWEAFNSFSMDDRFLELAGNLAEEHVAGKAGKFGEEGGAQWKDVGIFSEQEWNLLVSKGFESMCGSLTMYLPHPHPSHSFLDVPVGKSRVSDFDESFFMWFLIFLQHPNVTSAHADATSVRQGSKIKKTISRISECVERCFTCIDAPT